MMFLAWNWLRKNFILVLLAFAAICLSVALGKVIRGGTWSLLLPVSLAAVMSGWGLGSSQLTPKQAWVSLIAGGIPGVFIFVGGLVTPIGQFGLALVTLVSRIILWLFERAPVDVGPFIGTWIEMSRHAGIVLARLWTWSVATVNGNDIVDPVAVALVWNVLVWLACAWSGWQVRRYRQALSALVPGGALLALVIDYTRGETGLVIVYLATLLVLVIVLRLDRMQFRWQQRKVDYSDSIVFETLLMAGMVTIGLVLSAAGTPSLSWRELLDKLRREDRAGGEQVAESLGLEASPNVANEPAYRSEGLPRRHLLSLPPEQRRDVVLVISTGEISPVPVAGIEVWPERYYWRAITYDVYSGDGWRSSAAQETEYPANTPLLELPQSYRVLHQHIKRVSDEDSYVFSTGILAQADADMRIAWRNAPPADPVPASNGDMLGALIGPDEYNLVSYVAQIDADQLQATGFDYPPAIERKYLHLPGSVPERVLALAREVTQAALTPYDRAVAIERYLRSFPYTLEVEPPPSGRDVADYFLFTAREGYCDYYATTMAVLARAVGLPARIVVGYTSGEYDALTAEYIIRKENAHSWVEVYFSGIGWVEFEPTGGQPGIDRAGDESASGSPPGLPPGQLAVFWLKARWRELVASLGGQLLIAWMACIGLLFLWQVGEVCFLSFIPPKQAISQIYSRMEKSSSRLLPDLPRGHTPGQVQAALTQMLRNPRGTWLRTFFQGAESEIENIVELYVAQAFSPRMPEQVLIRRGILSWMRLRWRLWVAKKWIRYLVRQSDWKSYMQREWVAEDDYD